MSDNEFKMRLWKKNTLNKSFTLETPGVIYSYTSKIDEIL